MNSIDQQNSPTVVSPPNWTIDIGMRHEQRIVTINYKDTASGYIILPPATNDSDVFYLTRIKDLVERFNAVEQLQKDQAR